MTNNFLARQERESVAAALNVNHKPIVWIDKWAIETGKSNSPDGGGNRDGTSYNLAGYVSEHHKLTMMIGPDHWISTSRILMFDSLTKTAETRNTFYILDEPEELWKKILEDGGKKISYYDFDRRETHDAN